MGYEILDGTINVHQSYANEMVVNMHQCFFFVFSESALYTVAEVAHIIHEMMKPNFWL
jgi:hypothetical protein